MLFVPSIPRAHVFEGGAVAAAALPLDVLSCRFLSLLFGMWD